LSLLQALLVRNSQFVTSLGTTVSQHFATILGAHARAEAMLVRSLSAGGLIRPFHRLCYLLTPKIVLAGQFFVKSGKGKAFMQNYKGKRKYFFACKNLAQRFRDKKADNFSPVKPIFWSRCPASAQKNGEGGAT
jgi:hypothetical protein